MLLAFCIMSRLHCYRSIFRGVTAGESLPVTREPGPNNQASVKAKKGMGAHRGAHGTGLMLADSSTPSPPTMELWEATSTEQLYAISAYHIAGGAVHSPPNPELKSDGPCDTNLGLKVKRYHISELIHYEGEAEGIDTPASDLPRYQWELEDLSVPCTPASASNVSSKGSTASETNYIPTRIYGSPSFKAAIIAVCNKHLVVFNTTLSRTPASVPPMDLEVDTVLWRVKANKGPPRNQTLKQQRQVQNQTSKMLLKEVISSKVPMKQNDDAIH